MLRSWWCGFGCSSLVYPFCMVDNHVGYDKNTKIARASQPTLADSPISGMNRQPLMGLRMEDPSLPLPRFSPTKRKMRPDPIDVMAGLERVKVLGCCHIGLNTALWSFDCSRLAVERATLDYFAGIRRVQQSTIRGCYAKCHPPQITTSPSGCVKTKQIKRPRGRHSGRCIAPATQTVRSA
jgi:hypothetical protein